MTALSVILGMPMDFANSEQFKPGYLVDLIFYYYGSYFVRIKVSFRYPIKNLLSPVIGCACYNHHNNDNIQCVIHI